MIKSLITLMVVAKTAVAAETYKPTGKVQVVNYWATWCEACKVELKEMEAEFKPLFSSDQYEVKFVSLDKNPDKAKQYMIDTFGKDSAMVKATAFDPDFKEADAMKLDTFPTTIVVDKAGNIVKTQKGFTPGKGSTADILKTAQGLK